jgi:hypothetical protein
VVASVLPMQSMVCGPRHLAPSHTGVGSV